MNAHQLPPGRYDSHVHATPGRPDSGRFLDAIRSAGIAGAAVFTEDPDPVRQSATPAEPERAIDNLLGWLGGEPGFFPFYSISPTAPDALSLVDLALSKGIMGFKVLPGTFFPDDERALPVYAKIAEANKPVVFHSGILWDGRPSSRFTRPGNYEGLLAVPRLRFALAHVSWPWCDECIAVYGKLLNAYGHLGAQTPEMFIDLAPGTPAIYRREALTKLFTIGYDVHDHVMFATDGMTPDYGTEWSPEWQARDDEIYASLGLGAEAVDSIYRGAFERFLFGGPADGTRRIPDQLGPRPANEA